MAAQCVVGLRLVLSASIVCSILFFCVFVFAIVCYCSDLLTGVSTQYLWSISREGAYLPMNRASTRLGGGVLATIGHVLQAGRTEAWAWGDAVIASPGGYGAQTFTGAAALGQAYSLHIICKCCGCACLPDQSVCDTDVHAAVCCSGSDFRYHYVCSACRFPTAESSPPTRITCTKCAPGTYAVPAHVCIPSGHRCGVQ